MTQEELNMLREHMIETMKEKLTCRLPSEEGGGEEEPVGDLTDLFDSLLEMTDEEAESIGLHIQRPPTPEEELERKMHSIAHSMEDVLDRLDELEEEQLAQMKHRNSTQRGMARGLMAGTGLVMMGLPLVTGGLYLSWKLLELIARLADVPPWLLVSAFLCGMMGMFLFSESGKLGDKLADWASKGTDDEEDPFA